MPISTTEETSSNTDPDPRGLGGWLILVGIGIVFVPLLLIVQLVSTFQSVFETGTWDALVELNSLWGPIVIGEMIVNFGLVVAWIYVGTLFFSKSRRFPKWYIALLLVNLTVMIVDPIVVYTVLDTAPMFDADSLRQLFRSGVSALVWIPYMLNSRRVNATFVM